MRLKTFLKLVPIVAIALVLESCLKGDPTNFPEGAQHPFLIMDNNSAGLNINNPVSGLANFGNQSLGFPHSDAKDTATFFVSLEGTGYATKDIDISLVTKALDPSVLKDNYANDSLAYLFMPDSLYTFINTTATIAKGTDYATFKVVFYPSKFDLTQNYMLPVSAESSSDPDIKVAGNYGTIYYHAIGNVLAATYNYSYRRWNAADSIGTPSTDSAPIFWAPVNGTTLRFNGGYAKTVGLTAPYQLTFKQDPLSGALSNFKVTIDASFGSNSLAANGITITQDPAILKMTVTPTYRYFKIWYKVNNGTADRTLIDVYTWP